MKTEAFALLEGIFSARDMLSLAEATDMFVELISMEKTTWSVELLEKLYEALDTCIVTKADFSDKPYNVVAYDKVPMTILCEYIKERWYSNFDKYYDMALKDLKAAVKEIEENYCKEAAEPIERGRVENALSFLDKKYDFFHIDRSENLYTILMVPNKSKKLYEHLPGEGVCCVELDYVQKEHHVFAGLMERLLAPCFCDDKKELSMKVADKYRKFIGSENEEGVRLHHVAYLAGGGLTCSYLPKNLRVEYLGCRNEPEKAEALICFAEDLLKLAGEYYKENAGECVED